LLILKLSKGLRILIVDYLYVVAWRREMLAVHWWWLGFEISTGMGLEFGYG
jgi:hypothetical protein